MHQGLFLLALCGLIADPAFSQATGEALEEERNINQKIADVPLQVHGAEVQLSALYRKQPLIVAQVFTRCGGICTPYLVQLKESLRKAAPRKPYKVLVFSFDPRDSEGDMDALAKTYALGQDTNWIFATTEQIALLNHSIGLNIYWDEGRAQYEHGALLTGVNTQGIIKKKLIGLRDAHALSALVNEINNGFSASYPLPRKNSLFSCFSYDPATGKSKPDVGLLLMMAPVVLALGLIAVLAIGRRSGGAHFGPSSSAR